MVTGSALRRFFRLALISGLACAVFCASGAGTAQAQGLDTSDLVIAAIQPARATGDVGAAADGLPPSTPASPAGTDRWAPSGIVPSGPFKGRAVDTSRTRSVRLLDAAEAAPFDPAPGERLVANVQHVGRWWIARIAPDAVEDVIVHKEDIPGGLGHGQLRFRIKPSLPVTLLPQTDATGAAPLTVTDFVFTCDGTAPIGVTSPEPLGGLEQYVVAYRLMPLSDKVQIMRTHGRLHTVAQWRLDIPDDEKQAVLAEALRTGSAAGLTRMFSLAGHNCTSEMLGILDRSLHYDALHRVASHVSFVGVPRLIPLYLHERGLDGPGTHMPELAVELGEK